jgi:Uma2 family endonuclease
MVEKIIERVGLRPQGSWTYDDWLTFPDDGWKYEIINGELHMTPAPATGHQKSSISLSSRLYTYVQDHDLGMVLTAPCDVRLPNQPVPFQPDIFFIRKNNLQIIQETEVIGAPDLVIEILSPSNASYDRVEKFEVYQAAAVPEYWLVDYQAKTIEIFSLVEGAYQLAKKYGLSDAITSAQLPGFQLPVERVFDF